MVKAGNSHGHQAEGLLEDGELSSTTVRIAPRVSHEPISDILLEQLRTANTDEERVRLLCDIGNLGTESALDVISDLLEHASPLVRMQAVKSLRLIKSGRADSLILRTLHTDTEIAVRTSAAFAARFRRLDDVLSGLQQSAASDAEPIVRLAALDILGPAARTKPEVVSALEWLAKNDPDARVRERSLRFLRKLHS